MSNDHSRDELRRALADADAAQREAMPRFRDALRRLFTPDSREVDALDRDAKAALLGVPVPARRTFLHTSGLAVVGAVGAVALAACSDDDGDATGETGTSSAPTTAGAGDEPGPTAGDIDLAIAAIQIENTAVAAYDAVAAIRAADLQAAGATDAVLLFRDHHMEHAGALNGLLNDNGMNSIPEEELFGGITLPSEDDIATLPISEIAGFARGLENQAAQTYITAVPRLSLPILRQTLMSIGSIEAKHVAVYDMLLGGTPNGYATTAQLIVGGNYPTDESFLNA
jgi:hypothetical protein